MQHSPVRFVIFLCLLQGMLPPLGAQENVLLIIADDLGIDSLAAYNADPGASLPPTPTLDSLQAQGITFTRFYAYSTCSPTRAAIMTGRYGFRTGVVSPETGNNILRPNEYTLAEALVDSGVIGERAAQIGKWHLGGSASAPNTVGGWPHFSGALGGALGDFYTWSKTVNGTTTNSFNAYATTDNVDDAISWIAGQGNDPWFLWLAFNAPHTPYHRPPNELHDYDSITPNGSNNSRPHFEAMVQAMDTEIGRLLAEIDLSQTTVIFMGDNGTPRFVLQDPFPATHGKGTLYEGGIRVPLLVAGSAVDSGMAGGNHDGVVHACDLYATILDLFGLEAREVVPAELELDSRSFAAVFRGGTPGRNPAEVLSENEMGTLGSALVLGSFKYIRFDDGTEAFYDVDADLPETSDLLSGSLDSETQQALDHLREKLDSYTNTPQIHRSYFDDEGKFTVEVGWYANATFSLERNTDPGDPWDPLAGAEYVDDGTAVLVLRDPAPQGDRAFYRVVE